MVRVAVIAAASRSKRSCARLKLRNIQKGLDADDFNSMTFNDLFNALQFWYIEGTGDCERRAIESYGLGRAITNFEKVRAGDFVSYDSTPAGGHSVIFVEWIRDVEKKIIGMKYFSSNLSSNGIGYGQGKFSDSNNGRGILRNSLRIARVGAIKDYVKLTARTSSSAMLMRRHSRRELFICLQLLQPIQKNNLNDDDLPLGGNRRRAR